MQLMSNRSYHFKVSARRSPIIELCAQMTRSLVGPKTPIEKSPERHGQSLIIVFIYARERRRIRNEFFLLFLSSKAKAKCNDLILVVDIVAIPVVTWRCARAEIKKKETFDCLQLKLIFFIHASLSSSLLLIRVMRFVIIFRVADCSRLGR